jgi:aldose sugar dehydrogenase
VTRGVERPWGLAFLPNGDMLVTERSGRLRLLRSNGVLDPTPLSPFPKVYSPTVADLAGLFDIVLHPRFEQNRLIYFVYSKPGEEVEAHATTAIGRARYDGGTTLADLEDIFVADAYHGGPDSPRGVGPTTGSFGARLIFDDAGYLYVSLGERNLPSMSQDTMTHAGKILRLRDDGSTPPDNPFVGREGYLPEIYTLGHRNPLGLTIHPVTREMWSTEFGPRGGDELNRIVRGGNYGWYLMSHGTNYDGTPVGDGEPTRPGFEAPVLHWSPSINPGNLLFYYGDRFPAWRGNMLMAAMGRTVLRVTFDESGKPVAQERMLTELKQRFRDIRLGPDGNFYVLTDENLGAVLKIEPGR